MRTEARAGRREGVGQRRRKRHACGEGSAQEALGARTRAERTLNMPYMLVTLEVSKLSGWLKPDAPCRAERRVYAMQDEVHGSREVKGRGVLAAVKRWHIACICEHVRGIRQRDDDLFA